MEITSLVDNYSDSFPSRFREGLSVYGFYRRGPLKAEPGLSFLIKVYAGSEEHSILFDAGISAACLLHNMELLASSKAVLMGEIGVDSQKRWRPWF